MLSANSERIATELDRLSKFGRTALNGVDRAGYSPAESEVHKFYAQLLTAEGVDVTRDAAGSLKGCLAGGEAGLTPIIIGSHLDSVPNGGRYDGTVGAVGALEVVRILRESGTKLRHPLWVCIFACEEASRFGVGLFGSRAVIGTLTEGELSNTRDEHGITVSQAMLQVGLDPLAMAQVQWQQCKAACYFEIHIEQGKVLETEGVPVGIVTRIASITRLRVSLMGRADHSGSTPMNGRYDALLGASQAIIAVNSIVKELGQGETVATVGYLHVEPNSPTVVAGRTDFIVDIRDIDGTRKDEIEKAVRSAVADIATVNGLTLGIETTEHGRPVLLDEKVSAVLEKATKKRGYTPYFLPSRAGHDAMNMATLCPTGMIFVPSIAGLSHCPDEYTSLPDIKSGIEVLLDAVTIADAEL